MTTTIEIYDQAVADREIGKERKASYWHRSDAAVFNPNMADMRQHDAVELSILQGWLPERPFIDHATRICAFGSCFASNISDYLNSMNYQLVNRGKGEAYVVHMSEQLVTTFAIRQQFEWAFENRRPAVDLWYGYQAQHFGYDEAVRAETLELFMNTDVFILTFGLSEVWYDEPTGEVFWKAVPEAHVDPARHKFRVSTVQENRDNVRAIYDLIRRHRPESKIVCTLSPIPLMATFRPVSCITANSVSKAVLRAAVDEVVREVAHEGMLHYWPSYEIVMEGFGAHPHGGHFCLDRRHADEAMITYIMRLFEAHYCVGSRPAVSLLRSYAEARSSTGDLPAEVLPALSQGRRAVQTLIDRFVKRDDAATAEFVELLAAENAPPAAADTLNAAWLPSDRPWRRLSDQTILGTGPLTVPVPGSAWVYGAVTGPFEAAAGQDLQIRVTLTSDQPVGVLLIRADGSQIGEAERRLEPDARREATLRLFDEDGLAYLLVRNAGEDRPEGAAFVLALESRDLPTASPARGL